MIAELKNIFIVGIKGVAMANLAVILKKMGKNIAGSDLEEEFITDEELKASGINVINSFDESDLPNETDTIIYSAAHGGIDNPQVIEAQKRGIKIFHQAEFIGELMSGFKTKIAVCGSHGKTTTTSLLAYSLINLGVEPSYLVGSSRFNDYWGGDYRKEDYFVVEADEYGVNPPKDKTPKFHFLNPDIIVCTNIDYDHPDVFENLNQVKTEFEKFFQKTRKVIMLPGGSNSLDQNRELVEKTLVELGFKTDDVKTAMKGFKGLKRRFEQKAYENDTYLFDSYAHHPREIETDIEAAKARFDGRRLIVIFQPHTFSRTQALLNDFAQSLSKADKAYIMPIFASAREDSAKFSVSSEDIAAKSGNPNVIAVKAKIQLLSKLKGEMKKGDLIFTMGAGDIYKLDNDIIGLITEL